MSAERIEIVRTAERLAEVGPAWMSLWSAADGLVFQSHAWVAAWWDTVPDRERRTLRIVLAWQGDAVVAVLPLATCRRRMVRVLEWAAKDHSDYGDALVAPGADPEILPRLWRELCRQGGFDLAYLNRLLPDARANALHGLEGGVRLAANHRHEISYRMINTWPGGDAWLESQSKNTRRTYKRGPKLMEEAGPIRFRLVSPDEPLEPLVERLATLKRAWLTRKTLASDLYDEGAPALLALLRVLADLGLLRIFVLDCDGTPIAIAVNFVQADTMMAFLTTYDPSFERGSPGIVLIMDYTRWSFDRGIRAVDHLCGGESFKVRFSTTSVRLDSVIGARTVLGSAALLADRCIHAARGRIDRAKASSKSSPEASASKGDADA